jgi:uncharacterized protein YoxC
MSYLFSTVLEESSNSVVILDCGRGFENFVMAYGGVTFEMTSSAKPIGINALKLLRSAIEEPTQRQEALVDFTRFLAHPLGEISQHEFAILRRLSKDCAFDKGLSTWVGLLSQSGLEDLTDSLTPFVRGEIYGDHFDAPENPNLDARVLYFTGPAIGASKNPLLIPYFFVLNLLVAQRSSFISDKKSVILWDEVAFLMGHAPTLVATMWQVMRKTGNAVVCCAQNPDQVMQYSCGEDILQNSPTRWILGIKTTDRHIDSVMALNDAVKAYLRDRVSGDFFIVGREGEKQFLNFKTSPVHYSLFTTKKEERVEIERLAAHESGDDERTRKIKACFTYAKEFASAGLKTLALILFFGITATTFLSVRANASIFGEEDAILAEILAQLIQEYYVLKNQLDVARGQFDTLRDAYSGTRSALQDIKMAVNILSGKDREYNSIQDKKQALESILYRVRDLNHSLKQLPADLKGHSESVSEALVYQNQLVIQSDSTINAGRIVTEKSRNISPGRAAQMSAQVAGLQLQALGELQRSQAELVRLSALESSDRLNREAEHQDLIHEVKEMSSEEKHSLSKRPY